MKIRKIMLIFIVLSILYSSLSSFAGEIDYPVPSSTINIITLE